jgi:hypothetical protein
MRFRGGSSEHSNEPLGTTKGGKFLDLWLLKKDSVPRHGNRGTGHIFSNLPSKLPQEEAEKPRKEAFMSLYLAK